MIDKRAKCLMLGLALLVLAGCAPQGQSAAPSPSPRVTTPPAQLSTRQPASPAAPSASPAQNARQPEIPGKLTLGGDGAPVLKVYVTASQSIEEMAMEEYLQGVLAGEMKNDWPLEALKAQAIIARTFALKFIEDKGGSAYEGADVSTDVTEAQAYDAEGINDRVVQAIEETRGMVITYEGELTYAWFHAHAGGVTAMAKEGLEWEKEEPLYIRSVASEESSKAPKNDASWTASFPMEQVQAALKEMGFRFPAIQSIGIGKQGESGRTVTFDIDGTQVTAPSLRIRLGPTEFKSTLLSHAAIENGRLVLKGKGYGHGVGMSQWGAYGMAESGLSAEDIIEHYYTGVEIVELW